MTARWHIDRTETSLTLMRHRPARFDLSAETQLPLADMLSMAHQIRQDVWRVLQRVRGFSPVIHILRDGAGLHVLAGGRAHAPIPANAPMRVQAVLNDPANRSRWIAHANRSRGRP
ncbi:MAG: hypothetical protein AAGA05_05195 [Pseudomonadota bacterium]